VTDEISSDPHTGLLVTAVEVANRPWMFTQSHPLDTDEFRRELQRRGVELVGPVLHELYRHGYLVPFVEVTARRVGPSSLAIEGEPALRGTFQTELRLARVAGRLRDLAVEPFRPRLRFDRRPTDSRSWWNGLLYSRYQLLAAPMIARCLRTLRVLGPRDRRTYRLDAMPWVRDEAAGLRRIALVLAAIEARYHPKIDAEWLHLVNADFDEWERYRDSFDPVAESRLLGYGIDAAVRDAESLLMTAHRLDPNGRWSALIQRAHQRQWKQLRDASLSAIEHRVAAELLLLFAEDLSAAGLGPMPSEPTGNAWHPLHDRYGGPR
jgi:hypothetical protein